MAARFSAATERALERVRQGESMYAAAIAENISYNTIWQAVQRVKGKPPKPSSNQLQKARIDELQELATLLHDALRAADQYARDIPRYENSPARMQAQVALDRYTEATRIAKPKRKRTNPLAPEGES